jgi:hypothetical protein
MIGLALFLCIVAADGPEPRLKVEPVRTPEDALVEVHRVFVDRLTGGETAAQMRDMLISALSGARLFVITENPERADAVLRGAAEDLLYTDKFSSSEGINAHANAGQGKNTSNGTTRSGRYAGASVGDNESMHIEERKHEAMATVRLVSKDGDVIWSTTQESLGGKFRGASADVADKVTRQLVADYERVRKARRLP